MRKDSKMSQNAINNLKLGWIKRKEKGLGSAWNKGKHPSEETLKKLSDSHKGHIPWNKGTKGLQICWSKGKKMSEEFKRKVSEGHKGQISWNKGKPNFAFRGINHPRWKGGISSEAEKARKGIKYKDWSKKVFKKDNYVCQGCEAKSGNGKAIYLHAHHLYSFAKYPEYRFEKWNGQTLCKSCHIDLHHQFGRR